MEVANTLVPGSGTKLFGCSGECWTNSFPVPRDCGSSAPGPVDSWVQEEPLFHMGRSFIVTEPNWQALNIVISHLWTLAQAAASPPTPLGQLLTLQASARLLLILIPCMVFLRKLVLPFPLAWSSLDSNSTPGSLTPWGKGLVLSSTPCGACHSEGVHLTLEEVKELMVVSTHWSHVCCQGIGACFHCISFPFNNRQRWKWPLSYRFLNGFSHLVSENQNHILPGIKLAAIPSDFSAARDQTSFLSSPIPSYVFLSITTTLLLTCHYVTGLQPAGCWVFHRAIAELWEALSSQHS